MADTIIGGEDHTTSSFQQLPLKTALYFSG